MLSPKDNYLKLLGGELPDYVPSRFEPYSEMIWLDYYFKPTFVTQGFAFSPWGVRYVGSMELGGGGIPEPGFIILHDIRKWRDVIKNPSVKGIDFETHYKKSVEHVDRSKKVVTINGGEYFQTLVSFMGFEGALIAMSEEPDEVYELLDYVSQYSIEIAKQRIRYTQAEVFMVSDDCAAAKSPFFSPDMYKRLIKPFHKKHADLALEHGLFVSKHDCGKSEVFIPDWLEMGVRSWNPAQTMNDLATISAKYKGTLVIEGGWDSLSPVCKPDAPDEELIAALDNYVNTLAPGGSFTFSVMPLMGDANDERIERKNKLIEDYFFSHVRDYYNK